MNESTCALPTQWLLEFNTSALLSGAFTFALQNSTLLIGGNDFTSACLPVDACYTAKVTTADAEPDAFSLVWGGELLEGDSFLDGGSSFTFFEFGDNCFPNCNRNESLFELKHYTGREGFVHWRIEDIEGNELVGCGDPHGCGTSHDLLLERTCIPKDTCLRFLTGQQYVHGNPNYEIRLDNDLVAQNENVEFDSVQLGVGCFACDPGESAFEMFLYHKTEVKYPPLTYKLSRVATGESLIERTIIAPQNTTIVPQDSTEQYVYLCVPDTECYEFDVSIYGISSMNQELSAPYRVRLGGVFWADEYYTMGDKKVDVYNWTTPLGSCQQDVLCNNVSESVLLVTISTEEATAPLDPTNISWFVNSRLKPGGYYGYSGTTKHFRNGYLPGSLYKSVHCFPNDEELFFGVEDPIPDGISWAVEKNGELLKCRTYTGNDTSVSPKSTLTPLDGSCEEEDNLLSPGGVAGIAIGASAGLALLVLVAFKIKRRDGDEDNKQPVESGDQTDKDAAETSP